MLIVGSLKVGLSIPIGLSRWNQVRLASECVYSYLNLAFLPDLRVKNQQIERKVPDFDIIQTIK
jgi:hypothetical protein